MTIEAGCLGPVTTSPDESTYVGEVSGFVVKASPDDPNRPPLNPWTEHCPRGWPRPRICEMNEEELDRWKIRLRTDGRCLRLGVRVAPAVLPRSRRLRRALEAEAETDPLVRAALDRCVEAEQTPPGEDHPPPLQRGHPHPLSRDAKDRPETPQPPRRPKADVVYLRTMPAPCARDRAGSRPPLDHRQIRALLTTLDPEQPISLRCPHCVWAAVGLPDDLLDRYELHAASECGQWAPRKPHG